MTSRKELVEMMEKNIIRLNEAQTETDKKFYYDRCMELYEQCEVIQACYYFDSHARYKTEALKVKPIINPTVIDENTIFKKSKGYMLPIYTINCLDSENEHFPGLYFNGDIKFDPNYGKMYFVKCGGGNDISKRINQYATYNPMFYHKHTSCRMENWAIGESLVQSFIAKYAIGVPERSKEWFIVSEETYYKMCILFSDPILFRQVANGRRATL